MLFARYKSSKTYNLLNVLKRVRISNIETGQDDVFVFVRKAAKLDILFQTIIIPDDEFNLTPLDRCGP